MRKALLIFAAAAMGAAVQGLFFLFATHAYYEALPALSLGADMMPGLGEAIGAVLGGLLGALGGASAAGFRGPASWWIPVLMSAMLGTWLAATEIERATHPALALAALAVSGGAAGWIVAYLGKTISGQASDARST